MLSAGRVFGWIKSNNRAHYFYFLMGQPRPLFVYFLVFSNKQYNFCTKSMWKLSKCLSSIWRWDSNPQPFKHESSPITTRPGLLPPSSLILVRKCFGEICFQITQRKNVPHYKPTSVISLSGFGKDKEDQYQRELKQVQLPLVDHEVRYILLRNRTLNHLV